MKKTVNHNYVLIMAGGSGTRLFPRSTEDLPKQFQKILGKKTLIQEAYDRALNIVPKENIFISSNHKYAPLIREYLPDVPKKNYITEPVKKNTGPAIALATALIYKMDKEAVIVATHSDHLVANVEEYTNGILNAIEAVQKNKDYILCVGIMPTSPHTGFGYIERGKLFLKKDKYDVYIAKRFVEKPKLDVAKKYLASTNFFWNAGYFVWQAEHFLTELSVLGNNIYKGVTKIAKAKDKENFLNVLNSEFEKFESIAIDHLIMEKTKKLLLLPLDIGWSDVGSWDVVVDMVDKNLRDINGNYGEGKVLHLDTHNTTVFSHSSSKVVATIGVSNLIIVTTEEAIIIVPKGRSEEIKKIAEELKS